MAFAKHQTRLEFQYFIPLRKSTNRLNWELDLWSFGSNREVISICCHTTPAFSTTTEVVSQRLIQSTDSIKFIDRTKVPESVILDSLDVTRLYTSIPQEREYIQYARHRTLSILKDTPPIPTRLLDECSG